MFFSISKLLIHFERPSDLLMMLLVLGLGLAWLPRYRRTGLKIATAGALVLLAIAILPVAEWVTTPLESRFPRAALPQHVDGLIVLGGAVNPEATMLHAIPSLNGEAERMTEFVRLAKLYPQARLVFSGGFGRYNKGPHLTEADVARLFFRQQGLDVGRIIFEDRSRDTYENVLFSKAIVKPRRGEAWVLVSSARDVPRCVGVFRKLGWPVIAMPVAYKAKSGGDQYLIGNLQLLDDSAHEWLGLAAYRLLGRSDALFPAPTKS